MKITVEAPNFRVEHDSKWNDTPVQRIPQSWTSALANPDWRALLQTVFTMLHRAAVYDAAERGSNAKAE